MPLPHNINFDAVLKALLEDMGSAVDSWLNSRPNDEPVLLSRIIESLNRRHKFCDVGVDHPVRMTAEYYCLHRGGRHQTDYLGSDLAVTISIPGAGLIKTAFFQLKIGQYHRVILNARQLQQAKTFRGVHERSFILVVDERALTYRIRPSVDCLWHFSDDMQSIRLETGHWESLSEWVLEWFACKRGLPTKADEPHPVEGMLCAYKVAAVEDRFDAVVQANLPKDGIPTQFWFKYLFEPRG